MEYYPDLYCSFLLFRYDAHGETLWFGNDFGGGQYGVCDSYNSINMAQYLFPIVLIAALFGTLYSIFKSGKYKRPKQITAAIIVALILIYILYTCNSDNQHWLFIGRDPRF